MSPGKLKSPDGCFYSINNFLASSNETLFASLFIYICFCINGVNTKPGHIELHVIPVFAV